MTPVKLVTGFGTRATFTLDTNLNPYQALSWNRIIRNLQLDPDLEPRKACYLELDSDKFTVGSGYESESLEALSLNRILTNLQLDLDMVPYKECYLTLNPDQLQSGSESESLSLNRILTNTTGSVYGVL